MHLILKFIFTVHLFLEHVPMFLVLFFVVVLYWFIIDLKSPVVNDALYTLTEVLVK